MESDIEYIQEFAVFNAIEKINYIIAESWATISRAAVFNAIYAATLSTTSRVPVF